MIWRKSITYKQLFYVNSFEIIGYGQFNEADDEFVGSNYWVLKNKYKSLKDLSNYKEPTLLYTIDS